MPDPKMDPDTEPHRRFSIAEFRTQMANAIDRVLFDRERITITRRGRVVAVLTHPDDLTKLREIDAMRDLDDTLDRARMLQRWDQVQSEVENDRQVETAGRAGIVIRSV